MAIDFKLREFCHPRRIGQLHRTLRRTQWLPPDALQEYQDARLRAVVRHAAAHVPYYRALFARLRLRAEDIRTATDLQQLPLLDKRTLRRQPEALLADDADRRQPRWHRTSGTTGEPLRFVLDRDANALEFCYYWRHWSWAGYRLGARFAELGCTHFLRRGRAAHAVHWQPLLRRLMLNSGQVSPSTAPAMAAALRRHRPRFLKGMASALFHLARSLRDAGVDDCRMRGVFSTGEVLTAAQRQVIEQVFGCPVLDSYGHMERTAGIAQCPAGGYHVQSDYGLVELRDVRTASDGTRLARVVGTSLYNLAMPLLRYDVGDDVELPPTHRPCPCGRTLPLVAGVRGRTQDTLVTPDGRFITSAFVLFEMVDGIAGAQIVQEAPHAVRLVVVPEQGFGKQHAAALRDLATQLLGPEMKVEVSTARADELQRGATGKLRPVIALGVGG